MSKVLKIIEVQKNGAKNSYNEVWLRSLLALEALYTLVNESGVIPIKDRAGVDRKLEELLDAGPFKKWGDYPFKEEETDAADVL